MFDFLYTIHIFMCDDCMTKVDNSHKANKGLL